jgi:hypothetical protein
VVLAGSEDPAEPAVQVARAESEDPAVQVALVVSEDPVEPAVQESPVVPVAPERELVQGEAVLAREHPRARPAVALRTKSVTAAHRLDLVPLLVAEEDLAAVVAVTTREPAAAEAVIAWEVADTVAVEEAAVVAAAVMAAAVAVAVAVAVAAVAVDGDKHSMRKNK